MGDLTWPHVALVAVLVTFVHAVVRTFFDYLIRLREGPPKGT